MTKCNGTCGTCAACRFRASKGVTVVPSSTEPTVSNAEFERRAAEYATSEREAEQAMESARERAWWRRQGYRDE